MTDWLFPIAIFLVIVFLAVLKDRRRQRYLQDNGLDFHVPPPRPSGPVVMSHPQPDVEPRSQAAKDALAARRQPHL